MLSTRIVEEITLHNINNINLYTYVDILQLNHVARDYNDIGGNMITFDQYERASSFP